MHQKREASIVQLNWDGDLVVACKGCGSENGQTFNGEIALHFPGLEGLTKPIVWVFPKLTVCLNCGFTEFTVPERELSVLKHGAMIPSAVIP